MEYKILASTAMAGLKIQVESWIEKGWKPNGGHQAVVSHVQNRYAGEQHQSTQHTIEYSQSMIKE